MQYVSSTFHWWISKNNIKSKQIQTVRHNPDKDSCYEKLLRTIAFCELSFMTNKSSNIRRWRCTQGKIFGWKHLHLNSLYRSGKLIWHKDIFMCFLKYVCVKLFCQWKKSRYGWGILKWIFLEGSIPVVCPCRGSSNCCGIRY